jgi:hypothetical protein
MKMTATGVYKITEDFEAAVATYTGAPYCVNVIVYHNMISGEKV